MGGIEVVESAAALKAPGEGPAEFSILTYNVQTRPWFDERATSSSTSRR